MRNKKKNWRLERLKKAMETPNSYDKAKAVLKAKPIDPDEEFKRI